MMEPFTINTELVEFDSSDGLKLHGLLFRKNSKSVIINVFGMWGDFYSSKRISNLAKISNKNGFDVFSPSNRGIGLISSFEKRNSKEFFTAGTALENFEDCVHDIKGAIDAMKTLGYKNIILQGHSTGCQKIAYYQAKTKDGRVKALILLAPVDDLNSAKKELGNRFEEAVDTANKMVLEGNGGEITPSWISKYSAKRFLSYADFENSESQVFDYESSLSMFSQITCPILAVFGSEEQHATTPVDESLQKLQEKTSSKNFKSLILEGANHDFQNKEEDLNLKLIAWLKEVIQ